MMQDDVSNPGQTFAMGLTLENLSAHTIGEDGKPTFVTSNPMELLRKVCPSCPLPTCRQTQHNYVCTEMPPSKSARHTSRYQSQDL